MGRYIVLFSSTITCIRNTKTHSFTFFQDRPKFSSDQNMEPRPWSNRLTGTTDNRQDVTLTVLTRHSAIVKSNQTSSKKRLTNSCPTKG